MLMREQVIDLFGEVVVTVPDVHAWLRCVAGIDPDCWRAPEYVRGWRVVDKIRRAKLAGVFDELTRHSRIYYAGG